MQKLLILFSITLTLCACEKSSNREVVFEEAQPNTSDDETCFRKNIQGKYIYPKDSSLIIITDSVIKKVKYFKWLFHKTDIDSAYHANINDNNSIIAALKKDGIEAYLIGDTVFGKSTYTDTLFKISKDDKLRFFKGYYFLNTKVYKNAYHVLRMEVSQKKFLRFSKIEPYETLEKYEDITPISKIRDDSGTIVQYNMKPTRKELKRLMKGNAFLYNEEVYVKVKN